MRLLLAFVITVLVYTLLIWLYLSNFQKIKLDKKKYAENIVKIDIINIPSPKEKSIPKSEHKKVIEKRKIKKKIKKIKKIVKKSPKKKIKKRVKRKNKKKIKKVHTPKKKSVKKNIKKKIIPESEIIYIPNPIIKEEIISENLIFDNKIEKKQKKSYPNSKVKKLYGREFLSYTPAQKEFIEKNLNEIHKITQETLWRRGYPGGDISARTGQEGTNIVSFFLHPNGNISNLRLKRKVGYRILDDNTIETIKSAYKDYPYPKEKTKIIFFVEYSIFGY